MNSDHGAFVLFSILLFVIWSCGIAGWIAINKSSIDGVVFGILSALAMAIVWCLMFIEEFDD